jgi:hypothetical protein
VPGGLYYYLLS